MKRKTIEIDITKYPEMLKLYNSESPRAAAVLAAAFLETFLEKLLRRFLRKDEAIELLFQNAGPLSTLYAKTQMALGMGLITDETAADINIVRKIRNHFAHYPGNVAFADTEVVKECPALSFAKAVRAAKDPKDEWMDPRFQYLMTVARAIGTMHNRILEEDRKNEGHI